MKIILLEDVKGIGKANTVQEVKDGYAVNFLIPKKLAEYYNVKNEHELNAKLEKLAKDEAERRAKATELKEKIDALTLNFFLKTNHGLTFGSVSQKQIIEELKKHDINIAHTTFNNKSLKLGIGEHTISIKLYKDIHAELKINVEQK